MRQPLICGNWKMNKFIGEARSLAKETADGLVELAGSGKEVDVILGPPYLSLHVVAELLDGSSIRVAGQDCSTEQAGAFTGEVSAAMLRDAGATHVILGHSERRELLGEGDCLVAAKATAASACGLTPIICLGEPNSTRSAGAALERIRHQIELSVFAAFTDPPNEFILAYEPIWAIGTGLTATPEQAQEVHSFIRMQLKETYGVDWAENSRILYGGSMKPSNAAELLAQPDIDGGLIGGASLAADDFLGIIQIAQAA